MIDWGRWSEGALVPTPPHLTKNLISPVQPVVHRFVCSVQQSGFEGFTVQFKWGESMLPGGESACLSAPLGSRPTNSSLFSSTQTYTHLT